MSDFDPFEDDMRRTSGRYYPPEQRDECRCTGDTYSEPGAMCASCEARLETTGPNSWGLCEGCPAKDEGDTTRCTECPRRQSPVEGGERG